MSSPNVLDEIRAMLPPQVAPVADAAITVMKYADLFLPLAKGLDDGSLTAAELVDIAKKAMTAGMDARMRAELGEKADA